MATSSLYGTFKLSPDAAIKWFEKKDLTPSWDWFELWEQAHAKSFTVAKSMSYDILDDIQQATEQALKQGLTKRQYRQLLEKKLKAKGWWGKQTVINPKTGKPQVVQLGSPWRLNTIYRTNMQSAMMAGRWKRFYENKRNRPYLQYIAVMDAATRHSHAELHGKIFHIDDPIWQSIWPPNGFNCRCRVRALTAAQAKQRGFNPKSKYQPTDDFPDKGFNYNPAISQQALTNKITASWEKLYPISKKLAKQEKEYLQALSSEIKNSKIVTMDKIYRTAWQDDFPNTIIDRSLRAATTHALYKNAKAGDLESAYLLSKDLITPKAVEQLKKLTKGKRVTIVPVYAKEQMGTNKIPVATAFILSKYLGLQVNIDIVQSVKVSRTASDGWYRLANPPAFSGQLSKNSMALLVDDTQTQGGTFASLKGHIESQGSIVIGAYALTGKQYSVQLRISNNTLAELRNKYGQIENWWKETFGYGFDGLTEWEAKYIIKSGELPEQVRSRVLARRLAKER